MHIVIEKECSLRKPEDGQPGQTWRQVLSPQFLVELNNEREAHFTLWSWLHQSRLSP